MRKYTMLFLCLTIVLLCGTAPCSAAAPADAVNITIDGEAIKFQDATPFVDSSKRTQIPLRILGESLGYGVLWDPKVESVLLFKVDSSGERAECSKFYIGKQEVELLTAHGKGFSMGDSMEEFTEKVTDYIDRGTLTMDTAAIILDRRTYIPVRYAAEIFGNTVGWENASRTVIIETEASAPKDANTGSAIAVSRGTSRTSASGDITFIGMKDGGYYFNQDAIPSGGCLLTCIAMIASNMQERSVTPEEVYEMNGETVFFQWSIESTLQLVRAKYIAFTEGQSGEERRQAAIETLKQCPMGTMLCFTNATGNHSVVFTGYDPATDTIYVSDPSSGQNVPFVQSYTGAGMFGGNEDDAFAHLVKIYAYN